MNTQMTPASEWEVDQVIALDWYDGPRTGVCRFKVPSLEASFELLDERQTLDDLDDRIYYLRRLPTGSVQELATALSAHCGTPQAPIWAPIWPTDEATRTALNQVVSKVLAEGQDMDVVLLSRDFQRVLQVWTVERRLSDVDWFSFLGV
jgi:hypothetical protein